MTKKFIAGGHWVAVLLVARRRSLYPNIIDRWHNYKIWSQMGLPVILSEIKNEDRNIQDIPSDINFSD